MHARFETRDDVPFGPERTLEDAKAKDVDDPLQRDPDEGHEELGTDEVESQPLGDDPARAE